MVTFDEKLASLFAPLAERLSLRVPSSFVVRQISAKVPLRLSFENTPYKRRYDFDNDYWIIQMSWYSSIRGSGDGLAAAAAGKLTMTMPLPLPFFFFCREGAPTSLLSLMFQTNAKKPPKYLKKFIFSLVLHSAYLLRFYLSVCFGCRSSSSRAKKFLSSFSFCIVAFIANELLFPLGAIVIRRSVMYFLTFYPHRAAPPSHRPWFLTLFFPLTLFACFPPVPSTFFSRPTSTRINYAWSSRFDQANQNSFIR